MLSALGIALVWTSLSVAVPGTTTTAYPAHHTASGSTTAGGSTSGTSLTRGDRGPRVAELQRALIAAGVTVRGGADGIFGSATLQALMSFQTSAGLRSTGSVDATTAHLLGLGPAPTFPRRGERSADVATLQSALIAAGVTVRGGADGIFGAATEHAITTFQSTTGLSPTGRVDVRTAIALGIAPQGEPVVLDAPSSSSTSQSSTGQSNSSQSNTGQSASPANVSLPRRGQTSDAVAIVQRALIAAGVNVRGGADGIFGPATEAAVKVYQHGVRRPATGELDEITAQLLGLVPAPTLPRRGDRGDAVVAVQQGLVNRRIALRGGADGVFGGATETAIAAFQASQGLSATRRLDLVTFFLITDSEVSAPADSPSGGNSGTGSSSTSATPISADIFPVQGPCWFTDTWHAPRSGGRRHLGVDIIAPKGKAVYAVTDGIITRTFFDRPGSLGGNALRLTATDGTYFHYAHFTSFADGIELGTEVVTGQIIGYVGSTGSSSTPHLHFEYHPFGGSAVNPYPMVKKLDACKVIDVLPQPGEINTSSESTVGE